jgi:hypothetical protein
MVSHTADEAKAANVAAMGEQVGRVVVNVISLAITGGTSLYSVPSGFSGVDPTGQPNDDFETSRWRVISCFRCQHGAQHKICGQRPAVIAFHFDEGRCQDLFWVSVDKRPEVGLRNWRPDVVKYVQRPLVGIVVIAIATLALALRDLRAGHPAYPNRLGRFHGVASTGGTSGYSCS